MSIWIENLLSETGKSISSPLEMQDFGEIIGRVMPEGTILALVGELGAGKTHLVKGILRGLKSEQTATSPTFGIVHEYRDGRFPVCHFDFYRLKTAHDIEQIGWDDFLDEGCVILAEWADKFPELFPPDTIWVKINVMPEKNRLITKLKNSSLTH